MAVCGEQVGGGVVAFGCDLQGGHAGPHRAIENPRSVRNREKWELERSHAEAGLDEFQGVPATSQEGLLAPESEPPLNLTPEQEAHMRPVVVDEDTGAIRFEGSTESPPNPEDHYLHTHVDVQPTKQREGDQPLPEQTEGDFVQERIIEKIETLREQGVLPDSAADHLVWSMEQSMELGKERYGTPLQTFNGRDALQDALEEVRDAFVYLSSMEQAREATRAEMESAVERALTKLMEETTEPPYVDAVAKVAVDAILKATGG